MRLLYLLNDFLSWSTILKFFEHKTLWHSPKNISDYTIPIYLTLKYKYINFDFLELFYKP